MAARRSIERPGLRRMAYCAWQRRCPPGTNFYAQGLYGQILYIAPATRTVVLRLGTDNGDIHWPSWLGQVARLNP